MRTLHLPPSLRAVMTAACLALFAIPSAATAATPSITIGPVDCDAGGSVVTVSHESGAPVRVQLLRDEQQVATMVVAPGAPVTRVVKIAEGAASRVDARQGDSFTSAFVRRDCTGAQAPAGDVRAANLPAIRADAPFAAGPVVPATGVRDGVRVTAPQGPIERETAADLPSPVRTWPLLLLAAAALLAAALVSASWRAGAARDDRAGRARSAGKPTA